MPLPMLPADELAQIRSDSRTLELREAELRRGFLEGGLDPSGLYATGEVRTQQRRTFLKEALPAEILNDETLWTIKSINAVVVRPLGAQHRHSIRRGCAGPP